MLTLHDVSGRVVRRATVSGPDGHVDLARDGRLAPGLYWARLAQDGSRVVRGICVTD